MDVLQRCVCACVRACVRSCVHACVRACERVNQRVATNVWQRMVKMHINTREGGGLPSIQRSNIFALLHRTLTFCPAQLAYLWMQSVSLPSQKTQTLAYRASYVERYGRSQYITEGKIQRIECSSAVECSAMHEIRLPANHTWQCMWHSHVHTLNAYRPTNGENTLMLIKGTHTHALTLTLPLL